LKFTVPPVMLVVPVRLSALVPVKFTVAPLKSRVPAPVIVPLML
jgi:hypothetical protein